MQLTALEGIGLGNRFPELTEKLFSHTEDANTFHEHAISLFKQHIEKFRPDMLTGLGLSG